MSILIKGMEMPSGCDKCPFTWGNCIIDEKDEWFGRVHYNDVVVRIGGNKYAVRKDRPSWCPILCQLPERHGRLIDADALNNMINWSYPMTDRVDVHNGYAIVQEMMKQLQTIIEAEEGE